jgi:hypothetical protein
MNSITRIFSAAAILLFILPLAATSQSDRNHAIIEIKREAIISTHGNNQASGIRVLPGESYVGYRNDAVTSGRLINILDTVYFIPIYAGYDLKEGTNPNHHRAGLLRKPIITRLTKGGKEYYRLDVSVFKTYSDTVVIRTYAGSEILRFITLNQADIERSKIEPNPIIRISASGELTRFYDLPPYEEVEINRDYYQVFTREDNVECFWEKESGFLYELSDNKLTKIQIATENRPIVAEGLGNRELTMFKGSEWESEIISRTRDGKSFISFNVVVILLVTGIIVFFSYDWMKGVVSKSWQRLSVLVFPTFTIELDNNDTLHSLSEEYKVEIEEILKHNPHTDGIKQSSSLKYKGFKTIKIPKSKNYFSPLRSANSDTNSQPNTGISESTTELQQNENIKGTSAAQSENTLGKNTESSNRVIEARPVEQINFRTKKNPITFPHQIELPKVVSRTAVDEFLRKKEDSKKQSEAAQLKNIRGEDRDKEISSIFASFSREMELQKSEIVELKKNHDQTKTLVNVLYRRNNELLGKIEGLYNDTTGLKQQLDELIDENHNLREKLNQFLI